MIFTHYQNKFAKSAPPLPPIKNVSATFTHIFRPELLYEGRGKQNNFGVAMGSSNKNN